MYKPSINLDDFERDIALKLYRRFHIESPVTGGLTEGATFVLAKALEETLRFSTGARRLFNEDHETHRIIEDLINESGLFTADGQRADITKQLLDTLNATHKASMDVFNMAFETLPDALSEDITQATHFIQAAMHLESVVQWAFAQEIASQSSPRPAASHDAPTPQ